jgi:two-component sensor histidine kinase
MPDRDLPPVTTPATQPPLSSTPISMSIAGGTGAPKQARRRLLLRLDHEVSAAQAADAALIVSELVTNSVTHADVGVNDAVDVELAALDEHLRISVMDSGSALEPRVQPADPGTPGGFGLRLVEQMCSAWGFTRDPAGRMLVWCDLPLESGID